MLKQNHFVWVARFEGLSFLLLLLIAMPLKYVWGQAWAVQIVGAVHGILFLMYVSLVLVMRQRLQWNNLVVALALIAAVFPAGTFVFECLYFKR